jgi:hypothetical protein
MLQNHRHPPGTTNTPFSYSLSRLGGFDLVIQSTILNFFRKLSELTFNYGRRRGLVLTGSFATTQTLAAPNLIKIDSVSISSPLHRFCVFAGCGSVSTIE